MRLTPNKYLQARRKYCVPPVSHDDFFTFMIRHLRLEPLLTNIQSRLDNVNEIRSEFRKMTIKEFT